ncbi:hypothetical protein LPW11_11600 [Geomonas sp. RF6]|uniref:hypothetical protein n=1 Tax=Geomonas sp. RF6 TaxID=2897342 RepID=UPI001E6223D9|nr:hypothetical protein [Geomonas sp. RF6]UFS68562.1 hypothetical protein LPW11_11600 [Geomonas sp. RF6]
MTRLRGWKKGAALAAEAVASLFMVLASFGLFMAILYHFFPTGTPLREFIEDEGSGASRPGPEEKKPQATLASLLRDVRCRRGNSVAWGAARTGMPLFTQDAVQTFDRSEACILFNSRDQLTLGSNSLVLVNGGWDAEEQGARTVRVAVSGDVRGRISGSGKVTLELSAAGRVARIGGKGADFRITHKTSRSATLTVYAGEAEVVGARGGVRVTPNHGVLLTPGSRGVTTFQIPGAPLPTGPGRTLYRFRELPPKLEFSWTGAKGEYHFQLAKDERFQRLVKDLRVDDPRCTVGFMEQGVYFWRVSRVEQGAEGPFGRTGRIELQERTARPTLKVEFPPKQMETESCTVTGSTDPGIRIYVNGTEAETSGDGSFSATVALKRGVNLMRVEAVDEAGNASYASRVVYGKF